MKKRYKAKGPRLRAAALLLALLLRLLPQVSAGEAGTQYIVKYRDPADDAPFEVVSGAEM